MNCCNNMGAGDQVSHGNRQNLWCFTLNNQAYVTPKWREQRTQQQQWKTEVPTYRHSQQKYYRNLSNFWHLLNARLTVFDRKKFTRTEPQQRKKASNRLSRNSIRHVKKKRLPGYPGIPALSGAPQPRLDEKGASGVWWRRELRTMELRQGRRHKSTARAFREAARATALLLFCCSSHKHHER